MHLLIATRNAHKTEEIRAILGVAWEVRDLNNHLEIPSPDETGETFAENAAIKAVAASRLFDGWVLADDSGLEVDALGGMPGVRSARYAGPGATDGGNRTKLLAALRDVRDEARSARFRCAMALAREGAVAATFEGAVKGRILRQEQGERGFGYDSLFVPEGCRESFAELSSSVKNALSHRGRALAQAVAFLARSEA